MPLSPSPACLSRVAQHPTPLRSRFGCSDLGWHGTRALKPPVDDWVANGQPTSTLADLLRTTPLLARRLLDGWPTVVVVGLPVDLALAIDEVVRLGDRLPRIVVLPDAVQIGDFHEHSARCDARGVVLVRLREVQRLAARLPH